MADNQNKPQYSWVYQELTKHDGDDFNLVNNVAYIIYKQRKIEFYESHGGNPTEEQIKSFHQIFMMPGQLQALRDQAGVIVTDILNITLAKKITDLEARLDQEATAEMKRELEALKTAVNTNQTSLETNLDKNHVKVMNELGKINEEGWKAWLKETGKGVITTVLATIALWLLFIALNKGQTNQDEFTKKYLPTGDVPAASTPK
ncbi:hypothetical protein ACRS5A_18370 [Acinetobacter baumannii]|uniref:hypothetical protein n=1 Tax=Acinetobacter baumannii TaxID=470 RepID=UPI003B38B41B